MWPASVVEAGSGSTVVVVVTVEVVEGVAVAGVVVGVGVMTVEVVEGVAVAGVVVGVGVAVVVGVVVALSVTENCALRSEAVVAGACTSVWLRSSLGAVN